jgi:hypothetical protein|tara:strand:+ start:1093 stop:1326 length:234 start_codon:yes stop_codon:yes gene_type:complete
MRRISGTIKLINETRGYIMNIHLYQRTYEENTLNLDLEDEQVEHIFQTPEDAEKENARLKSLGVKFTVKKLDNINNY